MVELATPLSADDVVRLRVGDEVYLSGELVVARDRAHARLLDLLARGLKPPINMDGAAIYHAGPIAVEEGGSWRVISMGPTTSARFEEAVVRLVERTGARMVIGKGGLSSQASSRLRGAGAVYCAFPGGVGALAARSVARVLRVEWLDLGLPEALWLVEVRRFGPLLVAIDLHGGDLYREVREAVDRNRARVCGELGPWGQP